MSAVRILEAGVITIALAYKSYRLLGQHLHPGSDAQRQDRTFNSNLIGYFTSCFIFLLASSFLFKNKVKNTRNGLGGAVFSMFIPIIYLERYATADQSSQSFEGLLCHMSLCQVQLAVVLALSTWSNFYQLTRSLLFFLVASVCVWMVTGSQLEAVDRLIVALSCSLFVCSLHAIFDTFPQTFTFGEGTIICQALSSASLALMQSCVWAGKVSANTDEHISYDFISLILLVCWWILLVSCALLLVATYNRKRWSVTSADRKHFHLLAIFIFLPGILAAPHLIKLASAAALIVFVILEYIRYMRLPYLGEPIHAHLRIFLDKRQDSGKLILTHVYLLCGCSMPLWLTSSSRLSGGSLALLSGVISLGVGDTLASVIGSRFGRHHYPGSRKTLEGTLAAYLSMLVFTMALTTAAADDVKALTWKLLLVALLESCTEHVDNLVLPLYTFTILS